MLISLSFLIKVYNTYMVEDNSLNRMIYHILLKIFIWIFSYQTNVRKIFDISIHAKFVQNFTYQSMILSIYTKKLHFKNHKNERNSLLTFYSDIFLKICSLMFIKRIVLLEWQEKLNNIIINKKETIK